MSKKHKKRVSLINYKNMVPYKAPEPYTMQVVEMDLNLGQTLDSASNPIVVNPYDSINGFYQYLDTTVPVFLGFTYLGIASQIPVISSALSILPSASVKNWVTLTSMSSEIKIQDLEYKQACIDKKYRVRSKVKAYLRDALTYGGALMYFDVKGQNINMGRPLNLDSIEKNSLLNIMSVDLLLLNAEMSTGMDNPLSEDYFEPSSYTVSGSNFGTIHKSYFVKCVPEPIAPLLRPTFRFMGMSVTQKLLPYAKDNVAILKELPLLLKTKRQKILTVDSEVIVEREGELRSRIEYAQHTANNYNMVVLHNGGGDPNAKETLTQLETSLAHVVDLVDSSYNICASVAGIPVSKLVGASSPSGLGNAGDFDKNSWHETVSEFQESNMREVLEYFYKIAFMSEYEIDLGGVSVVFNSIGDTTDLEKSEIGVNNAEVISTLESDGIISRAEGKESLANRRDNNLNLDRNQGGSSL